jgi:hypothetical protein
MCIADRVDRDSDRGYDEEYSSEKPKNYSKRSSLFSRVVFRRNMVTSSEFMESRKVIHMAFMIACLYLLLNAMSVADLSFGSRPRVLHHLKKVETQQFLQADEIPTNEHATAKKGTNMLRSISSIYNKNDHNILSVIPKEEWENHAYLPMPKLEPILDESPIVPQADEAVGKAVSKESKQTNQKNDDDKDVSTN